ncbi:MAG: hypothetical protein ACE366_29510 [Bradymonadia bacterium]
MRKITLSRRSALIITSIVALDAFQGTVMVVWPALWHEWSHPHLTAPALFTWQYLGALLLARSCCLTWLWRRRRSIPAALWWVECPANLLLAWRMSAVAGWTWAFYLGRSVAMLLVGWFLGTLAGIHVRERTTQENRT